MYLKIRDCSRFYRCHSEG